MTLDGVRPVTRWVAHPPSDDRPGCPLVPTVTALECVTDKGSRWYGCERAYINSELRMVVVGFPAAFEAVRAWDVVPDGCVA